MNTQFDVYKNNVAIKTFKTYSGARRYVLRNADQYQTWQVGESIPREYYGGGRILKLFEFNPLSRIMVPVKDF